MTLSTASGADIDDSEAMGTIVNTDDVLPAARLARFGRAADEQVAEQVAQRMTVASGWGLFGAPGGREFRPEMEREFAFGSSARWRPCALSISRRTPPLLLFPDPEPKADTRESPTGEMKLASNSRAALRDGLHIRARERCHDAFKLRGRAGQVARGLLAGETERQRLNPRAALAVAASPGSTKCSMLALPCSVGYKFLPRHASSSHRG